MAGLGRAVSATRPPGATEETVLVAGTPIADSAQNVIEVLVSHDSARSFRKAQLLAAPGRPANVNAPPADTVVRPFLQQDPRPGKECHAYLAFGVYYASALSYTVGVQPPACASSADGCRSLAESETFDCGDTWSDPVFVVVDTGPPSAPDYRGFSYAIANDGTRWIAFADDDVTDASVLLKTAAADARFVVTTEIRGSVVWNDGPMQVVAEGSGAGGSVLRRWRPTVSASASVAVVWMEEDVATHESTVLFRRSDASSAQGWTSAAPIDASTNGPSCDELSDPFDNYMGITPAASLGDDTDAFEVAWTQFAPCGSTSPRRIMLARTPL